MPLLCVIPARLGSTRLANKPLRLIGNEPLIRVVARRAKVLVPSARIVVATDAEVVGEALGPSIEWIHTGEAASGTARVAQVALRPEFKEYDTVLNLQGDEPFISKLAVQGALDRVKNGDDIGTAAGPLTPEAMKDPDKVKVGLDPKGRAVAFTRNMRAPAPCDRGAWLHHIGVYAYTKQALERWMNAPVTPEELEDRLEQIRPLKMGLTIGVAVVNQPVEPSIDNEDDLKRANARVSNKTIPPTSVPELKRASK